MHPTLPSFPDAFPGPSARRVPYARADAPQISEALLVAQGELQHHFERLDWTVWTTAFLTVQPDLWVDNEGILLDEHNLACLAQHLAALPNVRAYASLTHGSNAVYLARKMVQHQDTAIRALAILEAKPWALPPAIFELVLSLAGGNGIAETVYAAACPGPHGPPGTPDPAHARAGAYTRIASLRLARYGPLG